MNRNESKQYQARKQRYVTKDAEALHEATGITPLRFCSFEEATVFANHLNINLHIMDMSSFKWEFIYHTHKGTDERPHVFILYLDRHYDAITDVSKVLRAFSRNQDTTLCYQCYQTFDRNYTHYCGQEPKPKKKYEVGGQLLNFFPFEGEEKEQPFQYIQRTKERPSLVTGNLFIWILKLM